MRAMNTAMTSNMYTFAVITPIKLVVRIVTISISAKQASYILARNASIPASLNTTILFSFDYNGQVECPRILLAILTGWLYSIDVVSMVEQCSLCTEMNEEVLTL